MQTVSLINLTKGRSNPAHGEKEQADDRHLEHTEMKNPPIDRNLFDSFGVLVLGFDATEMDVKTAFRMLARCYHPDKNDPEKTGMNRDQATAHFQLLNTANSYLRSVL